MNDYSRGYAAGLKAAAALVPTDDTRELCCNGYDCECRKPEDAAFVAAEIEARRVKKAILSLPIVGEADQRGAAAQELPAVNSARPAASDSLSPELSSGEPVLSSSVIRDSAQQPAQSAPLPAVSVPRTIDRAAHRHVLDVWNDCMENAETLETTWRRLVEALVDPARPGPSQECVIVPVEELKIVLDFFRKANWPDTRAGNAAYRLNSAMLAAAKEE